MIGHYLLTLTPEQEDRVLTRRMWPGGGTWDDSQECLVSTAENGVWGQNALGFIGAGSVAYSVANLLGRRFDALCHRFGTSRVNAAIRARIIENRARRALSRVTPLESCVA